VKIFSPEYTREEVVDALRAKTPQLLERLPLRWVVLFGSYANGSYTAFSDIDLLVVYAGGPREDAFAIAKRTYGLRGLEPHVLSEEEFAAMLPTWQRMLQRSVNIWGQNPGEEP
jgi:predicted nucleotidyltransferase